MKKGKKLTSHTTFQKQNNNPNTRAREPQVLTATPMRMAVITMGTRAKP